MKESQYGKLGKTILNVLIRARVPPYMPREEQPHLHCMAANDPVIIKIV